jgi:oligopeptidase B
LTLVYRKGVRRGGDNPLLLRGYGAYGVSYDPDFDADDLVLLDRGVVLAIAHVRGGGDLGKAWHDAGRMLNKRNTFTDFVACADFLVKARWTRPERLAISGRSAGGLLIGAVLNLRPELFRVAILGMPFLDVLTTMSDHSLPLTVGETEEWGDPRIAEHHAVMKTYSPYDNLRAAAYPAILVRSAFEDSQVFFHEPAKWVARLRTLHRGSHPVILRMQMEAADHSGAAGRYDRLREIAHDHAFLLTELGVEKP